MHADYPLQSHHAFFYSRDLANSQWMPCPKGFDLGGGCGVMWIVQNVFFGFAIERELISPQLTTFVPLLPIDDDHFPGQYWAKFTET